MASLTITAYHTRRAINWAILGLIAYLILRLSWGIFAAIWLMLFPPPPTPANHAFGKLPAIQFPKTTEPTDLRYRLETVEGYVPPASESAMVFFMPKNPANLLALTNTKEFAKQLEFANEPVQESKYLYIFTDPQEPLRQMQYDIVSKNFTLRYLYRQDPSLFTERDVPLAQTALMEAQGILQNFQLYPSDIADGSTHVQFLKFSGDTLIPTTSHSQSDALRIDYFRGDIAATKIFYPNPDQGPITFIYSGSKLSKKRLLEFTYNYWPIDPLTTATYTLKTSTQAWQELQSGGAYIARFPKGDKKDVIIRKIYLGYYDSLESQTYLQPIFVFEGDNGFMAYVPAVASPWTE
ncbi:MAG: hypothetical protein UW37_C0014G0021 [Candidatus Gottesmanbacteria bacterium GW2011_GWA2_44_17]|uniref:Uncharacterized protein n=3 Tax=Candidatus Gottesmaniibacteriota TaxID=1752720 RepID=A0A0G1KW65_9BACT|nr:MAG: hypothetical protein UV63_C0020G0011 [Microgenomates group bacterium GW2011_GWC1_43_11]KKT38719.1 MAG: hypothetical protein UW22_C0007G0022 [Candidatus Gottesmanbacteria bacterium GW2011_GWB1_44_11c]KKT47039.1 MAG: hypothetical protein UW37_C0014G0021 [Candidatus Gottesmanbacteria bacterium GW2011_GWA2_44_17]KKT60567.1 MAG: hypothetical protein UW52_C0023G0010 [Candidatus Gottesmanbacteria bacterium GW2011_GWA1_44_24b]HCM82597.1 hypothetical protein [Patescibacteria group bacterium]